MLTFTAEEQTAFEQDLQTARVAIDNLYLAAESHEDPTLISLASKLSSHLEILYLAFSGEELPTQQERLAAALSALPRRTKVSL